MTQRWFFCQTLLSYELKRIQTKVSDWARYHLLSFIEKWQNNHTITPLEVLLLQFYVWKELFSKWWKWGGTDRRRSLCNDGRQLRTSIFQHASEGVLGTRKDPEARLWILSRGDTIPSSVWEGHWGKDGRGIRGNKRSNYILATAISFQSCESNT